MSAPTDPREILRCAADHIERVGLHRGWFWPGGNTTSGYVPVAQRPCCSVGAIRVCGADPEDMKFPWFVPGNAMLGSPMDKAIVLLREHLNVDSVPVWNDREGRTAAEVAAAMRAAAGEVAP